MTAVWQSHASSWDQPRPAHIGCTFGIVTASFATYLTPHAALDPPSSIIKEAAAMHPDTSIMHGSQPCSCTICSNQQAVCGFSSCTSRQALRHAPAVRCRRSNHAHSCGWQHRRSRWGGALAADTRAAAGAGCPGPHHSRGPHEQAESGAQSGPAHAGQWQLWHSCSPSRQAAPPIC